MIIYRLLLYVLLPFILCRQAYRSWRWPAYRPAWKHRFGILPPLPQASIWIHAVSVGETQAIAPLVERLLQQKYSIIFSTTTPTGADRLNHLFPDLPHFYFPYDLNPVMRRVFNYLQPRLLILVETEIWPNLIYQAQKKDCPVLLANARLSDRSARRYARFKLSRQLFHWIDWIAAQTESDAQRFIQLGADPARLSIMGNIKFDRDYFDTRSAKIKSLWSDRPVWIAASTHDREESIILAAHQQILQHLPNTLLILVPRHPERFESVVRLCQSFKLSRRSQGQFRSDTQVYIGDTMGELPALIGASDLAFIGGSLVPIGGHNPLEAVGQRIPVLFGPHMFNFNTISALLIEQGAARIVHDQNELAQSVLYWLNHPNHRQNSGLIGYQIVKKNRGALQRLFKRVQIILSSD